MKYTRRYQDGFVERKALQYWRNLIANLDEKVGEREFFDFFERQDVHRLAIKGVRAAFSDEELESSGYGAKKNVEAGNLGEALYELWNERSSRDRCRKIVLDTTDKLLKDSKRGSKSEVESHLDSVVKTFGLTPVEKELLAVAFITDIVGMKPPEMRFGERTAKMNTLAMTIDFSFEEVRLALDGRSKLLKYGCLDDEYKIRHDPIGDYLGGSDTGALESKFYKKVTDETLPWKYFGEMAEREGAFLKKLLASRDGKYGLNVLLYGAPGTGKTSFAKCLARELGFDAYEVLQGEEGDRRVSAADRIVGIRIGNERLPRQGVLMLVDEADEILRTNSFSFGFLFGGADAHGCEKGVVNTLLDSLQLPMIWIVNTPAEAMDPSVRRRFDYSICFRPLSARQREMIWRNSITRYGLEKLVPDQKISRLSSRYETSAGGIALVAKNLAALKPKKADVDSSVRRLIEPHCELVGADYAREGDVPVEGYSVDGLNIKSGLTLEQTAEAVREFYQANRSGFDASRPRLNLLFWGPPGTGKTEFAKYIASCAGRKLKVKMGSDLLSKWVGGTERNLADAFKEAEEDGAILFLDEIDGMVQARGRADHSWEVTQVNELLHSMENFNGVLIGATNFLDNLDPAIMRRFTMKVQFDYLDEAGKNKLFERIFSTKLAEAEKAALKDIDNVTPGDMAVVQQNLYYLHSASTNLDRIAALEREVELKRNYHPHRIGFGR